jgi:putative restriction endonuclease
VLSSDLSRRDTYHLATVTPSVIRYGEVPEVPVGSVFPSRRALRDAGIHRPLQAGIDFASGQAAASVVLSGVYPDDDQGDVVIYTGQGGLDPGTSRAVADQKPILGNAGLIRSRNFGVPVRVIRKVGRSFRYDGVYVVDNYFRDRHASDGFIRWRYELRKVPASAVMVLRDEPARPERVAQTIQRIVRDTAITREVKRIYDYTCQICRISLPTPIAPYAEAAHIRPLGRPHNGKDAMNNVLCLCPNDHVLFDFGAITIIPERLTVTGDRATEGQQLLMARQHHLDLMNFDYHREAIFVPIVDRPDR